MGLTVVVLGAAAFSVQAWTAHRHMSRSAGYAAAGALAPIGILILLALAVAGVAIALRPKRTIQQALMVVASSDTLVALSTSRPGLALAGAIGLSAVVSARSLWSELSDGRASRLGRWMLVGAAALAVSLFLYERPKGTVIILFVLLLLVAVGAGLAGLILLVRNAPLPTSMGPLAAVYQAHASSGISPFTLMHDKRHFWNFEHTAYLAYAARAGAAVVLGPGVGPKDALPSLYAEFRTESHRRGWRIGFYQVPQAIVEQFGWGHAYRIGSEALVELERLTLEGSEMAKLRHEVSRGRRNGVTITLLADADLTPETRRAMRGLTDMRLMNKRLGEMGFSVGRAEDAPGAPTTVALAHNSSGELVAFATWLWLPAARGVALDAMRRRADAPGGAMDLLLYTSLDYFKDRAGWASLGLAPAGGPSATSLSAFKAKFKPRWEPRYMVAERLIDWPAAAAATLLVHYPRLTPRLPRRVLGHVQWLHAA